ncbi:MAG: biotin--[acetyl-CoA-carboxylase] ligase [Anaerolineales bacterium]|nr:biotin--[acetyl-CoA-carboxylase] ligase [Anaerolineales bacterium]
MDQKTLEASLSDLPINAIRFLPSVDSTNDEAARWVEQGAPDAALIIADEQIAGRGRAGRQWNTPPGVSLAFSMIFHSSRAHLHMIPRMTALGALAVRYALQKSLGLRAKIKWPNDVLLNQRKVAGVLAEIQWDGDHLKAIILGIGINIAPESVSEANLPASGLNYQATCIEEILGKPVDRVQLLHDILSDLLYWKPRLGSNDFLNEWESSLAFRGEWVQVSAGESYGKDGLPVDMERTPKSVDQGQVIGLTTDGSLKLRTPSGEVVIARVGELRLLPKS